MSDAAVEKAASAVPPSASENSPESQPKENNGNSFIDLTISRVPPKVRWANVISQEEWTAYRSAIETVRSTGVRFMLGGGFALAVYTGRWRDTKDVDFYVHPECRQIVIDALTNAGFVDYFDKRPYERHWIYRSTKDDVIVDIIWGMANQRARVDPQWLERANPATIRSQQLLVVPPEEYIWCKLYIMQRDHSGWTDIFNMLHACGPQLDWDHLIWRVDEDLQLLKGMLMTYSWLCPHDVLKLPDSLWQRLELPKPQAHEPVPKYNRIRLFDSREWFVGFLPEDRKLAV